MADTTTRFQSAVWRYGLAVVVTAAAAVLRVQIEPLLGGAAPFLVFTLPVFLAALLGGPGPGFAATGLATLAAAYFFLPPYGSFLVERTPDRVQLVLFVAQGVAVSWFISAWRGWRRAAAREREALGESEERFRLLVEGVADYAIFMIDPDGTVASWNTGARNLKGYAKEEIVGKAYELFYTPDDRAAGRPGRNLRTAEEKGVYEGEGWRVKKDGSRFYAEVAITALRDPAGRLRGYAKVTRDVTERLRAREQLQRAAGELEHRVTERTAQLQEANAALEAFAYTISHDLRAPLRAMQGFGQALLEDYGERLDDLGRDYASRIVAASADMDRLIMDLLEYSRLQRRDIPLSPLPLGTTVATVLAGMRADLDRRGAEVTADLPPDCRANANHAVLGQIVANLLSNAVKFVAPGVRPRVEVACNVRGDVVRLSVGDNGIGVAPEHHRRIFNVFERLHGGEQYPGTGIGLAIVRKAAERMGGSAGVESAVGAGSTFWVELPAAPPPQAAGGAGASDQRDAPAPGAAHEAAATAGGVHPNG